MSGTFRSGVLFGTAAFLTSIAIGILALNLCAPFAGVIWGVAAGITSISWSDPLEPNQPAAAAGAKAGAIAGIGAFLGLAVGMTIWFTAMGGRESSIDLTSIMAEQQGLELPSSATMAELARYSLVAATSCIGTISVALLSAAGAVGAYFYSSSKNKRG